MKKKNLEKEIQTITENIEKLEEEISAFVSKTKTTKKIVDDLNFDITNLKISVSSFDESETSINEFIERINNELENNNKTLNNKKN